MSESPDAYFVRLDDTHFRPTGYTGGAWAVDEQHISPMAGLIVHAVECAARDDEGVISRISLDILGVLPIDDVELRVSTIRPGRTIELVEVVVTSGGRPAVRARVWRLVRYDTSSVAGGAPAPLPAPDTVAPWSLSSLWPGGYIASLQARPIGTIVPGRGSAWLTTDVALVADEPSSELARFVALVDTANGIAVREDPAHWLYANVDLNIHLYRSPRGRWVGLDSTVIFGASGQGVTSAVLFDENGAVGRAEQLLTVRPRADAGRREAPARP
jgi:hypothetical protein